MANTTTAQAEYENEPETDNEPDIMELLRADAARSERDSGVSDAPEDNLVPFIYG